MGIKWQSRLASWGIIKQFEHYVETHLRTASRLNLHMKLFLPFKLK